MGFFSDIGNGLGVGDYLNMADSVVDNIGDGDFDDAFLDVVELGSTAIVDYYTGGQGGNLVGAAFDVGEALADDGDLASIVRQSLLSYYTQDTGIVNPSNANLLSYVADNNMSGLIAINAKGNDFGYMTTDELRVHLARENAPQYTDDQLRGYMEIDGNKADEFQAKALQKQEELLALNEKYGNEFNDAKRDLLLNAIGAVFSPDIKSLTSLAASFSDVVLKGQISPAQQKVFDEMLSLRKTELSYREMVDVYLQELKSREQ